MTGFHFLIPGMLSFLLMAAPFHNALDLYKAWMADGLPDAVSAVYEDDQSRVHVILKEGEESAGPALIDFIEDQGTLIIEYHGQYSENELQRIAESIRAKYPEDSGVMECYVGYGTEGGFGESGREPRVIVETDPERADDIRAELTRLYDDRVWVQNDAGATEGAGDMGSDRTTYIMIGLLVVLFTGIEILINHRSFRKEIYKDAHRTMARKRYFEHHGDDQQGQ